MTSGECWCVTRRVQVHAEAEERLGLASDAMADKTALEE